MVEVTLVLVLMPVMTEMTVVVLDVVMVAV